MLREEVMEPIEMGMQEEEEPWQRDRWDPWRLREGVTWRELVGGGDSRGALQLLAEISRLGLQVSLYGCALA